MIPAHVPIEAAWLAPVSVRPPAARTTIAFTSSRGRAYLYDDASGAILPWSDVREDVLRSCLAGTLDDDHEQLAIRFGREAVVSAVAFVRHWAGSYGGFVRRAPAPPPEMTDHEILQQVRDSATQLVLVVTENCNLRCKYCVFSGRYAHQRTHSLRHMPESLAKDSVDWFVRLVEEQHRKQPRKQFALTFYGGEPLVNVDVIAATLEHAAMKYPGLFQVGLTTNGTLLTPEIAGLFVRHELNLAVSLDGPEADHDRRRVDRQGEGTHARVMANLRHIRTTYPEYWQKRVTAMCVFDHAVDMDAVARFFAEHEDAPRPAFVSLASDRDTSYWDSATPADHARLARSLDNFRAQYRQAQIDGTPISPYVRMAVGFEVFQVLIRQRLYDRRPACLPFSGACVPGRKVAVQVDGTFDICERVNGTRPLGHLYDRGIDPARVRSLLGDYQRTVLSNCGTCPASRFCNLCFVHVLRNGTFGDPSRECAAIRARVANALRDYVSIMEANPQADFSFETDTTLLEKRFLFLS